MLQSILAKYSCRWRSDLGHGLLDLLKCSIGFESKIGVSSAHDERVGTSDSSRIKPNGLFSGVVFCGSTKRRQKNGANRSEKPGRGGLRLSRQKTVLGGLGQAARGLGVDSRVLSFRTIVLCHPNSRYTVFCRRLPHLLRNHS